MTNYFIAIGGSGSKVLESLVHLCAAGLMPGDGTEDLYVMGIDPDNGNGNLNRAKDTYNCYKRLKNLKFGYTNLMKTPVSGKQPDNYFFSPVDEGANTLDAVMDYHRYADTPIGRLYEVLYTKEERNEKLDVGFRGHPAIGAAVLAKNLHTSTENSVSWKEFTEKVVTEAATDKVKIFLAGSIFGGTGAAGVPNVARLLKNKFIEAKVWDNVVIGGGLVLPYFYCMPSEEEKQTAGMCVTSREFIPNTQAALNYYALKMGTEPMYHSLYLVGYEDNSKEIGQFSPGAQSQKNDAHVVDLYTALAALHFYGSAPNPIDDAKCYYTGYNGNVIGWNDLPSASGSKEADKSRLAQFIRFALSYQSLVRYYLIQLKSGTVNDYMFPWYKKFRKYGDFNLADDDYDNFNRYMSNFLEWARQISLCNNYFFDPSVFIGAGNDIDVNRESFTRCIGGENSITMEQINDRLCKYRCDDFNAQGFGQLMRVLYDSCAV